MEAKKIAAKPDVALGVLLEIKVNLRASIWRDLVSGETPGTRIEVIQAVPSCKPERSIAVGQYALDDIAADALRILRIMTVLTEPASGPIQAAESSADRAKP